MAFYDKVLEKEDVEEMYARIFSPTTTTSTTTIHVRSEDYGYYELSPGANFGNNYIFKF